MNQSKRHSLPPGNLSPALRRLDLDAQISAVIQRALIEDVDSGDVTTNLIVAPEIAASAAIVAKQDGIVSGLAIARAVFLEVDEEIHFITKLADGDEVRFEQELVVVSGSARAILTAERTALNFLGRMSGIASLTRQFVEAITGTKAVILDTRKTAPGLRAIDKLAVLHGGGRNHRFGLYDMILIKDNHIDYAGSLSEAIKLTRDREEGIDIEVEVRTIAMLEEALRLGLSHILLDNMSVADLRRAVAINDGHALLEASGNVTLDNVRKIAETGVDAISVGALTHSAKAFDVSLRWLG